jgi:RNA polymerase sigma-70 factor (ECF subfamily)
MGKSDYTDMGGVGQAFLTTHWSLIEDVGSDPDNRDRALIGLLLEKYWKPVYCYLRRKGYPNDEAKDLTQGFFHEAVLGRGLFEKADQSRGRFRSFLLIALNRYLINAHKAETAQKRIPKKKLVPLDMAAPAELPNVIAKLTPEESFNYAWLSTMLEEVLEQVENQCHEDGKTAHWHVFHDRVLLPITDKIPPPPMSELCERYGIGNEAKASNMIITVKRRFQAALQKRLRNSVVSDGDVDEEFTELKKFFPSIAQDGE